MRAARTLFLVLFIWAGILWLATENASGQTVSQTYTKPQPMPFFILENLQGKRVDIRDHKGQVMLLNFWSSW